MLIYPLMKRDFLISLRSGGGFISGIVFFIILNSISLLCINNVHTMDAMSAIIWLCVVFSLQSSMPNLLDIDYRDGMLEQLMIQGYKPYTIILTKIFTHWTIYGGLISITMPLILVMAGFDLEKINLIHITTITALCTLNIVSINSIASSISLGDTHYTTIATILILPFLIPILITAITGFQTIVSGAIPNKIFELYAVLILTIPVNIYATTFITKYIITQ